MAQTPANEMPATQTPSNFDDAMIDLQMRSLSPMSPGELLALESLKVMYELTPREEADTGVFITTEKCMDCTMVGLTLREGTPNLESKLRRLAKAVMARDKDVLAPAGKCVKCGIIIANSDPKFPDDDALKEAIDVANKAIINLLRTLKYKDTIEREDLVSAFWVYDAAAKVVRREHHRVTGMLPVVFVNTAANTAQLRLIHVADLSQY